MYRKPKPKDLKTQYICHIIDCKMVFDSMHALRKHCRGHDKVLECSLCGAKFVLQHDYSWHTVQCLAAKAADQIEENGDSISVKPSRRRTRSQGLSVHSSATLRPRVQYTNENEPDTLDDYDDDCSIVSSTRTDSVYEGKQIYARQWADTIGEGNNNNIENVDCADTDSMSSGSCTSSERSMRNSRYFMYVMHKFKV